MSIHPIAAQNAGEAGGRAGAGPVVRGSVTESGARASLHFEVRALQRVRRSLLRTQHHTALPLPKDLSRRLPLLAATNQPNIIRRWQVAGHRRRRRCGAQRTCGVCDSSAEPDGTGGCACQLQIQLCIACARPTHKSFDVRWGNTETEAKSKRRGGGRQKQEEAEGV
jgi:hypothetical protein